MSIQDTFIRTAIVFLLIFSPLIYGGVASLPIFVIEATTFLLIFVLISRQFLFEETIELPRIPAIPIAIFFILVLFQLILIPANILSLLSPATTKLYTAFGINSLTANSISICPDSTIKMFLQLLSYIAIFFVVLNYADSFKKQKQIIICIIACGVLYALIGVIRRIYSAEVEFSTFANRDHFSAYIELIIPLSIAYALLEKNRTRKMIAIFMTSVMVVALFVAGSRAARICSPIGLMIFALVLKRRSKKNITIPLIILAVFIAIFFGAIGLDIIMSRMDTLSSPLEALSGRLEVVIDSLALIRDFPVFGTGFGTFGDIFHKYKTFELDYFYRFAHNEPLQLIIETGLAGFILLLISPLLIFISIVKAWTKRLNTFPVTIVLGSFIGLWTVMAHSMVEFVFQVPSIALLFFVLLALAYRTVYTKEPQENNNILPTVKIKPDKRMRSIYVSAIAVIFIVLELSVYHRYAAEIVFDSIAGKRMIGIGTSTSAEYVNTVKKIDRAISANPLDSKYWRKKGDLVAEMALREDIVNELVNKGEYRDREELIEKAVNSYRKSIELNPTNVDNHVHLGWLYSMIGNTSLSDDEFRRATLLDPKNKELQKYISSLRSPKDKRIAS